LDTGAAQTAVPKDWVDDKVSHRFERSDFQDSIWRVGA